MALSRAITEELHALGRSLSGRPLSLRRSEKLIFLCGANRAADVPSYRREAVERFIHSLSREFRVVYAESVFNELAMVGHHKNALDVEHDITEIADKVVIILESPGSFCELGAFAHTKLRGKLIVVNDQNFQKERSFINTGPILALNEAKSPVLWYPMSAEINKTSVDGIGLVFSKLKAALLAIPNVSRGVRDHGELKADKMSLYFAHDLVYLMGMAQYKELTEALTLMFGKRRFDSLSGLLGVLRASNLVARDDTGLYRSLLAEPFFNYGTAFAALQVRLRHFQLKTTPQRFKLGLLDRSHRTGISSPERTAA